MPEPLRPLVAIHQPNFLPWLGYFDKICRADVFVLLDDVQYPKTGGNWTNHVRVLIQGTATWITVPVVRAHHGLRRVREVEIDARSPWKKKLLRTLEINYRKAPAFDECYALIVEALAVDTPFLAELNVHALNVLRARLGLVGRPLVRQSELGVEGRSTHLLVDLVRAVGGRSYLSGGGAGGYQEDDLFEQSSLQVVMQSFSHPSYPQFNSGEFVAGLSIVDAIMNCGVEKTGALLGQGQEPPPPEGHGNVVAG